MKERSDIFAILGLVLGCISIGLLIAPIISWSGQIDWADFVLSIIATLIGIMGFVCSLWSIIDHKTGVGIVAIIVSSVVLGIATFYLVRYWAYFALYTDIPPPPPP